MVLAWIGALVIGLALGILGSGGSILAVPILIYLVGEPEKAAIAESLFIVGTISLTGVIPSAIKKQVHWKSVVLFGLPGMAGSYTGAWLSGYVSSAFQLIVFAVIMLVASGLMFRGKGPVPVQADKKTHASWKLVIEGLAVGMLTGLIGVGGGFLIVPVLVLLVGLEMSIAVGTSLFIIALNSFTGIFKHLDVLEQLGLQMNWELILIFSVIGGAGSLAGKKISAKLSNEWLRKIFAVFLVVIGIYIIYMNF